MACWVTVVGLITAIVGNWVQRRLVAAAAAAEREAELFDEFSALAISESELEPQAAESAEPEAEEAHEEAESDGEADAGLEDVDPEGTDSEDTTPEDAEPETTEDAEEVKPDGGAVAASKGTDEDSWPDGALTAVKDAAGPEISAETETDGESDTDVAAAGEVEPGGKNH